MQIGILTSSAKQNEDPTMQQRIPLASRTVTHQITTSGAPKLASAPATDVDVDALGAKPRTFSESKSWGFSTDPWDAVTLTDGTLVLRLSSLRFTVVRYDIGSPPYKACYMTIRANWETQGWWSVHPAYPGNPWMYSFGLEVAEAGGGAVETFGMSEYVRCPSGQSYSVVRTKDVKPEIYDIVDGAILTGTTGYFSRCPS